MSPTHKVRRCFIIACFFSVVILVGLSWKVFSNSNVLHFTQDNTDGFESHVHPHKIKPTLKIATQALKEAPANSQHPDSNSQPQGHLTKERAVLKDNKVLTGVNQVAYNEAQRRKVDNAGADRDALVNAITLISKGVKSTARPEKNSRVGFLDTSSKQVHLTQQKKEEEENKFYVEDNTPDEEDDRENEQEDELDETDTEFDEEEDNEPDETNGEHNFENDVKDGRPVIKPLHPNSFKTQDGPGKRKKLTDFDTEPKHVNLRHNRLREPSSRLSQNRNSEMRNRNLHPSARMASNNEIPQESNENPVLHQKLIPVDNTQRKDDTYRDRQYQRRPSAGSPLAERRKPLLHQDVYNSDENRNLKPDSSRSGGRRHKQQKKPFRTDPRGSTQDQYPNFGTVVRSQNKNEKQRNSQTMESFLKREKQRNSQMGDSLRKNQPNVALPNVSEHNERFRQMIEKMERSKSESEDVHKPEEDVHKPEEEKQKVESKPASPDTGVNKDGTRKDACAHCFHSNFPALIDHRSYCQSFSQKTIVLLLISSAPSNSDKRQAIRKTWGSKCQEVESNYRCLFVLGEAGSQQQNDDIRKESDRYKDIIQFGFKDAYSNLTYKTLTSMRWASTHCADVRYVMKTDDDMYVNTELIPTLLTAVPRDDFVGGFCWGHSSPNRDAHSKWYVPFRTFSHPQFPPMCSGTGYILSRDVVRKVLDASENIPFFHLEDVYVALCLQKYGIRPRRIEGFNNMYVDFDACQYRRNVMTSHQVPTFLLEQYWSRAQQCSAIPVSGQELFREQPYPPT